MCHHNNVGTYIPPALTPLARLTQPPSPSPTQQQVASTVTGAKRQWAVYDESFSDWLFNGTDALPKGSMIFAWNNEDEKPAMTAAGYDVVAVPWRHW